MQNLSARIQDHFVELSDPRRRKVTHQLINIITAAICAVICDADDFVSIICVMPHPPGWGGKGRRYVK
jgi:hypothetical protein